MSENYHDYHCGPSWLPRSIKRWAGKFYNFNESCALHDGLNRDSELSRIACDNIFLNDMLKKSNGSLRGIALAYFFYSLARSPFGWISYHLAKVQRWRS